MDGLAIDYGAQRVTVDDRAVALTATEFALLRALTLDAGGVSTYESLLRRVWGGRSYASPELVRTYVKKLRRKLGEHIGEPRFIFNERAVGYRMATPDDPDRPRFSCQPSMS